VNSLQEISAAIGAVTAIVIVTVLIGLTAQHVMTSTSTISNHKIKVVTSFFPLYDFARHVSGDRIEATSMVPIGAEPHDWEPTVQQVQAILSSDVFVYNGAGIDKWDDKVEAKIKVDSSHGLKLLVDYTGQPDPHTWLDPIMVEHQVE